MQSRPSNYTYSCYPAEEGEEIPDIATSVMLVENLLKYSFKNKKLLEEALTHSSYTESASYQRLEFLGDSVLGLAISSHLYIAYPDLDPGKLSLIRSANISTERLARIAVSHQLYKYVRHNATSLDEKVREFVIGVQQEQGLEVYGGLIKAPKVLADIVESVSAAVYVDCNFNLASTWTMDYKLSHGPWRDDLSKHLENIVSTVSGYTIYHGLNIRQPNVRLWEICKQSVAYPGYQT